MTKLVDRFLKYVKFDTQSDELTNLTPSTPGQMVFAKELEKELQAMGLSDISLDDNGYLFATLPANTDKPLPTIGFTIPEQILSATNIINPMDIRITNVPLSCVFLKII